MPDGPFANRANCDLRIDFPYKEDPYETVVDEHFVKHLERSDAQTAPTPLGWSVEKRIITQLAINPVGGGGNIGSLFGCEPYFEQVVSNLWHPYNRKSLHQSRSRSRTSCVVSHGPGCLRRSTASWISCWLHAGRKKPRWLPCWSKISINSRDCEMSFACSLSTTSFGM